jgi:hypothetical protein
MLHTQKLHEAEGVWPAKAGHFHVFLRPPTPGNILFLFLLLVD